MALVAEAEAEGLTLLPSEKSATGFQGVTIASRCKTKPHEARVKRDGKDVRLGSFATAEEAALIIARTPEGRAAAAAAVVAAAPLSAAEARRQAEAEGLTLLPSESNATGFHNVHIDNRSRTKPYEARVRRGGEKVYLGYFATPEEAALAFARSPEGRAAAAAAPRPAPKRKQPATASPPAKRARPPAPPRAGKAATAPTQPKPAAVKHESKPPPMPKGAVVEETLQQPAAPAPAPTPSSGLLGAVAGLIELVKGLPQAKQDAALAWCAAQEVADVALIAEGRFDDAFVRALGFAPPAVAGEVVLRKRLAQLRAGAA